MKKLFTYCLFTFCLISVSNAQNHSIYFDGISAKIGVLDSPVINPSDAFTLEAWINSEEWANDIWAGSILSKEAGSPDEGYSLRCGANGRVGFNMSIDGIWNEVNSPEILGLNTWYHVAGVYTGSEMRLYINGELISTIATSGASSPSTGNIMNIGENPTWSGRYFQGLLDEVRIWDVARTQAEIQANMSLELTGDEMGLAAYWPFNEGSGNLAADASLNSNDGQLLNMDDNNWMDGFVPVTDDLGAIAFISPSMVGTGFSDSESIKIEVKNQSSNPINSFEVYYQIDGEAEVSETVNQTLEPFESYLHTFAGTENLSGISTLEITGGVDFSDDQNSVNDIISASISQSLNISLFDGVQHNFGAAGQTHFMPLAMPENLDEFSHIYLHVDLACPNGGCDPWDQAALVRLLKDGETYEIARYITPYGMACGPWVWDISDFRSLMTESVTWESFVQVWGSSGWLVDMELEFVPGVNPWDEVTVHKLWSEDYWVYGDPDISYDLPEFTIPIQGNTEEVKIRMTTTGHGQGNTNNAAEFMNQTHVVHLDGAAAYPQDLWRDDCGANECANQFGTWTGSRFGWCPGQDVQPWMQGLTSDQFTPGADLTLDYVLEEYTNLLNTGYNNSGHTEPFYRIHAYVIEYSGNNVSVDETEALNNIDIFPNPNNGQFVLSIPQNIDVQTIEITDLNGRTAKTLTVNNALQYDIDISEFEAGIYLVNVSSEFGTSVSKIVKE